MPTFSEYTGNGVTKSWPVPTGKMTNASYSVYVNGVLTVSSYTLGFVSVTTAPVSGANILIRRDTLKEPESTIEEGSQLTEENLNALFEQSFDLAEEAKDLAGMVSKYRVDQLEVVTNQAAANASASLTNANTALTNANTALTKANSVEGIANSAVTTANNALSTVNSANANATNAVNTANGIAATANSAQTAANNAVSTANNAQSTATTALNTANSISTTASNALSTANSANSTASTALSTANSANTTANSANTKSNQALALAQAPINNAATATKLQTARAISIAGDASGSASFDGSANATISLTLDANDVLTRLKTVDGAGSGLDADTVDGLHASSLWKKSELNLASPGLVWSGSAAQVSSTVLPATGLYSIKVKGTFSVYTTTTTLFLYYVHGTNCSSDMGYFLNTDASYEDIFFITVNSTYNTSLIKMKSVGSPSFTKLITEIRRIA